jgi:hypothetical protein
MGGGNAVDRAGFDPAIWSYRARAINEPALMLPGTLL